MGQIVLTYSNIFLQHIAVYEMGKTVMGFEGAKGRIRPLEDFEYAEHKQLLEYKRNLVAGAKNDGWE